MADESTKVVLDLDNAEFVAKLQESLGLLGELGNGESLSGLVETLTNVGSIVGVVAAGFAAFKIGIDLVTEAEKINQINTSFEKLAQSVGIAGDDMKNKLLAATKGLISDTDALQLANQAIVKLGDNANKIPEIMELARKATAVFGGDLSSNFEKLSTAIAGGNTKMLRHYGIVVDATVAEDAYAKSLGVGREYLDDSGKRMAVLTAALAQGAQKFKDIDETSLQATNSLKKIGTNFTELKEAAALAWNAIAGPAISSMLDAFSQKVHGWVVQIKDWFGTGKDQSEAHKENLQLSIQYLEQMIPLYEKNQTAQQVGEAKAQLAKLKAELDTVNQSEQKNVDLQKEKEAAAKQAAAAEKTENTGQTKGVDYVKLEKAHEKFENDLLKLTQARVQAESKVINTESQAEENQRQEVIKIRQKEAQDIENLDKQYLQKGVINRQQFDEAVKQIHLKANADVQKSDQGLDAQRITALKNYAEQNKTTAKGITAAWHQQSRQAEMNFMDMNKVGQQTFGSLKSHSVAAFEAIGNGSQSAGSALKGFFFGSIGDTAIAQGTEMLLSGVWPPNPVAIAGGGALIAFGAALKSAGTSSGSSAPSADTSSASSSSSAATASAAATTTPTTTSSPQSSVQINFAGSYFDTEATQNRLVEMIRANSDATDFSFKQIGTP